MQPLQDISKPRPPGFTILELLASITILLLLVVFLAQILTHAATAYSSSESNKERLQNERVLGEMIREELQAALLPINRPSQTGLQFVVNPADLSDEFKNRDAIFWQAPIATDQTLGDIAEIGYFIQWNHAETGNPRASLCRFMVNQGNKGMPDSNFLIHSNPSHWLSDTLLSTVSPADRKNGYRGLFAENVVGLWIRCLESTGKPIVHDASGATYENNTYDSRRGYTDGAKSAICALPAAVEISLLLLDPQTAARVTSTMQPQISNLVRNSSHADEFIVRANVDPLFQPVKAGIRAYQTTIYLQNSK